MLTFTCCLFNSTSHNKDVDIYTEPVNLQSALRTFVIRMSPHFLASMLVSVLLHGDSSSISSTPSVFRDSMQAIVLKPAYYPDPVVEFLDRLTIGS